MAPKSRISKPEVFVFKELYCNENEIIARLLKEQFSDLLVSPVLDVGSGIGDIPFNALDGKEVTLLELNDPTSEDYPLRDGHRLVKGDFFDYKPDREFASALISHTLQFLDDDRARLDKALSALNIPTVVLVLNTNDDIMGELVRWSEENFDTANPEVHLDGFPTGYHSKKRVEFQATLTCPDFRTLAKQVAYLMVIDLGDREADLIAFLQERLNAPGFTFNQTVEAFVRK